jgi:DNA-binding Lrp family transcriptional regulator
MVAGFGKSRFLAVGIFFVVFSLILIGLFSAQENSAGDEQLDERIGDRGIESDKEMNAKCWYGAFKEKIDKQSIIPSHLIVPPFYSKINSSEVLDNRVRANIFDLVSNNPGISFKTITRELRISNGTAQYHLRVLEKCDYINSRRTGKHTRYYTAGESTSDMSEIQEKIVSVIRKNSGISQSDIAKNLDISRQLVNYHVRILTEKKVITVENQSNSSSCFLIDKSLNERLIYFYLNAHN